MRQYKPREINFHEIDPDDETETDSYPQTRIIDDEEEERGRPNRETPNTVFK